MGVAFVLHRTKQHAHERSRLVFKTTCPNGFQAADEGKALISRERLKRVLPLGKTLPMGTRFCNYLKCVFMSCELLHLKRKN